MLVEEARELRARARHRGQRAPDRRGPRCSEPGLGRIAQASDARLGAKPGVPDARGRSPVIEYFKRRKAINRRAFLYGAGHDRDRSALLGGVARALGLGRECAADLHLLLVRRLRRRAEEVLARKHRCAERPARFRQGRGRPSRSGQEFADREGHQLPAHRTQRLRARSGAFPSAHRQDAHGQREPGHCHRSFRRLRDLQGDQRRAARTR